MTLDLPDEDIDFVMQVLQNQPLPFVRTAPLINRIGQQIAACQRAMNPEPLPESVPF